MTVGFWGKERVDYITFDTKGIWRCYEIKISRSDFHSKAKLSFVGHYNYYVLTEELYNQVKDEIPRHIGVYIGQRCVKNPKKQELKVDEQVLKNSMIRSLYREFEKQYKSEDENIVNRLKRKISRLERENKGYYEKYLEYRNGVNEEKALLRLALKKLGISNTELEDEYFKEESIK